MTSSRKFLKSRPGSPKQQLWEVTLKGNVVETEWGVLGGSMQFTSQEFAGVNIGKANEKKPEDVAKEFYERLILKKRDREGYREMGADGTVAETVEEHIDFSKPIPPHARFYKPQNSMSVGMEKVCAAGNAWYVRKRNGEALFAVKHDDGEWRFYSSKMLISHKNEPGIPWTDRYPHIVDDLDKMNLPNGTILLGELAASRSKDDLQKVGSVTRSLCDGAMERQKDSPLHYCLWDIGFWDHECWVKEKAYRDRYYRLAELVGDPRNIPPHKYQHISLAEVESGETNFEAMRKKAKALGWEGWVVINPDVLYGEKALNFRGKAERPAACCKLKPMLEADFIVRWDPNNKIGTWGKGKKSQGVGAVFAYLYNPETGQEEFVSKVGGGLTDELVAKFADPSLYPMVWQVEFSTWTPAGSIQFSEFVRVRDDKTVEECTIDQRPELEEEA
jgi:predicted DNA-binding WGR domain protein